MCIVLVVSRFLLDDRFCGRLMIALCLLLDVLFVVCALLFVCGLLIVACWSFVVVWGLLFCF